MTIAPIDELDTMQFDFDRQMLTLQSKLDTLSTLVDFERNIDFADEQPSKQQQALTSMTFFDPDDIHNLTRLPIKCADLSSLVEKYENEQHYLESLNLRKVVTEVFKTLEKSLVKVNEYLGQIDTVRPGAYDFNYDFMQQVTQQRDYLDGFTSKFMRLINQVLTLNDYIKQKEKIHLTQIESLASQNQALFDENCTLQRQLLLRQQQSDASLYPPQQQTQSQEQLRSMTLKEQKRLVKEVCRLHSQKLEAIKASLQSSSVSQIEQPLPKLQSLPLEDPKIYTLINDNLNILSQLQEVVKQKVDSVQAESTKCKERMTQIMGNYQVFKRTFDDVNSTLIPKCRSLLAIDAEYIRSTILNNRDMMDQAILSKQSKQLPDSISSLNVMKVHEAIIQKIDHLLIQLK
ncbi:hypothetical protein FGO68_gene6197 [Halteria grandinella]|uniref:Uncharacterized protein n=1 Tax=Halteria grandinella TaxID=5974 RepID=A0A8J8P857_HALGN|nr:hypothetical protein FGO68_gene6197 [Halteria grandinella]